MKSESGPAPKLWASIYATPSTVCIVACSGYRSSGIDPAESLHLLPATASPRMVGAALAEALSRSRTLAVNEIDQFFHPEVREQRYNDFVLTLLKHHGLKGKRALFKNMKHCAVESQSGVITIRPTRHEKLEGWAGANPRSHVSVPASSPHDAIGAAVEQALERCE